MTEGTVRFKVIREQWILLSPLNSETAIDKWIVRANCISKPRVVPDTHRDKTQEARLEGFVRVRPSRSFEIDKLKLS